MLGWHFVSDDKTLGYDDGRIVRVGRTYKAKGYIVMCKNGMHASKKIIDALDYAKGGIICRVELTDDLRHDLDKSVGRNRKVLNIIDGTMILHEFACRSAEDAHSIITNPDERSIAAIRIKRLWMEGKATDTELSAARDAAWDAARDAEWDAASTAGADAAGGGC